MRNPTENLLLAFYGDDITGSTDALDGLARNGVPCVLFTEPPAPEHLEQFNDLKAVGIAGTSRAMTPAEMDAELPSIFRALNDLNPPLFHYKVCSTFDSSPELGSIGKAIDIGDEVYRPQVVPISQGTTSPHGRYVAFGNLFAEAEGKVYRLDRHPTMSTHPRTPMKESDLRRHLGKQTTASIGLLDVATIEEITESTHGRDLLREKESKIVVLDALTPAHLETIGGLLWELATERTEPAVCVGSSGIEHNALPAHWKSIGLLSETESRLTVQEPVDRLLVMSGSAAPTTAAQVDHATSDGFEPVRLDTPDLIDPKHRGEERQRAVDDAVRHLCEGRSVVLYSAQGPDDPVIKQTRAQFDEISPPEQLGEVLGTEQGRIVYKILEEVDLSRICVAGGDTSGAVISELGLHALEPIAATVPGAPLCEATAHDATTDGLEVVFKGGQTGNREFFSVVKSGGKQVV